MLDALDSFTQDARHAARVVWRAKAFTASAVLTLALGIAATTVMGALIQGVLLRPLPVQEQERLILAWKEVRTSGSARYPFGDREVDELRASSRLLASAAGVTRNGARRSVLTSHGGLSTYANVGLVTGSFFDVLGVRPLLGRTLTTADDRDGAEPALVISRGFWQRHYGGARNVIGRRVIVDDLPFTIAGVMPADLDYPAGVEIWRTTRSVPATGPFGDAARRELNLIARLRPGVTIEQATSELTALAPRLEAAAPASSARGLVPIVRPFAEMIVGDVRVTLLALAGAVGLVLLIACANVANLLLMRGEARRGELALRAALGAGRGRIIRMSLAESALLSLIAGVAGLALASAALQAIVAFVALVPDGLPRVESIRIDSTVILFALAAIVATALLSGLAPTWLASRGDLVAPLRGGAASIAGRANARGRRTLVIAQAALAVAVLAAAGLLIRSVWKLQAVDVGLPADRLVLLDLHLPRAKYVERHRHEQFLDEAIARLQADRSVAGATPVNGSPFSGQGWDLPQFTVEGQDVDAAQANPSLHLESIHPNYFATFDIPLRRGRAFTDDDREGAPEVAIVSDDVAARVWPGMDPVGKRLKMGAPDKRGSWYTVVGVAARTRYRTLFEPRPTLYLPARQFQMTAQRIAVRSAAPLESLTALAGDRLRAIDPDVRIMRASPFSEILDRPLARPRFNAWLLGLFAAAALLLSTVGLYAVMAAHVRQRDRELAVRLALGATTDRVRRMVLLDAARLAGAGALLGIGGASLATRFLRGMLFEVHPLDPATLAGAGVLVIAAALLATCAPARRATRTDIVAALRSS